MTMLSPVFTLVLILACFGVFWTATKGRIGSGLTWPSVSLVAGVLACLLALAVLFSGGDEEVVVFAVLVAAVLLAIAWVREFVGLMSLGDESFPGRYDKLIWAALLVVLPPVGLVTFSVYRKVHWPSAKPSMSAAVRDLL